MNYKIVIYEKKNKTPKHTSISQVQIKSIFNHKDI